MTVDISFADSLYGWVITNKGIVWLTQDGGKSWKSAEISKDIPLKSISSIQSRSAYILNQTNDLYKNVLKVSIEDFDKLQSMNFILYNNYPNPFNSETIISYEINHQSHVRLDIYNLLGEKIYTLVDKFQNNGFHKVRWKTDNMLGISSGIYFYVLSIDNKRTLAKKMFLIK